MEHSEHLMGEMTGEAREYSLRKMKKYLRYLLFFKLGNKGSTNKILEQLRKVNWTDREDSASFAYRCLTLAWEVK